MDKIIVYGLGKRYRDYKEYIEKNYEIEGYYDAESSKYESGQKQIRYSELPDIVKKCDYILVTPSGGYATEIRNKLLQMDISPDKIRLLSIGTPYKNCWKSAADRVISPHAEHYEDIVVDIIREKLKIPYEEFNYIDAGVNDPIINNNTYYFYERGARGVLVEANPDVITTINEARPSDIILNRAIFEESEDTISFYISKASQLSSVFNQFHTMSETLLQREISIETIKINDVLKMAQERGFECKFLSLDIEGYDYIAISHTDFNRYRPIIIMIEMIQERDLEEGDKIIKHMSKMDYTLVFNSECNGIFVDNQFITKLK